jgi:hypothetical protein
MRRRYKPTFLADTFRCVWPILTMLTAITSWSAEAREIKIASGTYGKNCGASPGNATAELARQCDGLQTCRYVLREAPADPPSVRCRTDFRAEWFCTDSEFHTAALSANAAPGSTLVLSCVEEAGAGK